jgi:hypothetical protein
VQKLSQSGARGTDSSGFHSPMSKVLETTRVPGFIASSIGRSLRFSCGNRNSDTTVALEKSDSKMSPRTNVARPATPSRSALRFASATRSGLYSMPCARAPRLAATMTVMPSPEPRSTR